MAQLPYTKKALIERIVKHLNDKFSGDDFKISNNEILLYIDAAIPFVLKSQMFEMAKVTGVIDVPEAYLVNYEYTLTTQDTATREWYVTLAQTPLELPTGYDITNVYIADPQRGRSGNALPIKNKRVAYRDYLPRPSGFSYRLEGQRMYLRTADGSSLLNFNLVVQMPISRTDNINDAMSLPDGAIEPLFTKVVTTILQRYGIPQDVIADNLPAGNKTS